MSGKSTPLLFNSAMARAVLSGAKTQTRRPLKLESLKVRMRKTVRSDFGLENYFPAAAGRTYTTSVNKHLAVCANSGAIPLGLRPGEFDFVCPYASGSTSLVAGQWVVESIGDSIWGRETFHYSNETDFTYYNCIEIGDRVPPSGCKWTPSIHMPRERSRIVMQVRHVRFAWLRDITAKDAIAEGIPRESKDPVEEFKELWIGIYGSKWPWEATLVWVIQW